MTTGYYHHNNKVLIKHLLWWQHTLLDDSCKIPSKLDKFPPFFAVKFLFVLSRERTISIPRTIKRPLYGGHWMEWRKLAEASHKLPRTLSPRNWRRRKDNWRGKNCWRFMHMGSILTQYQVPTNIGLYWPSTTMSKYHLALPYTGPVPPSTNQYCPIMT